MSSTVRYYRYDDAGAPTITGQVGSLTTLLRTVLVGTAGTAYGSKPSAGWTEQFAGTGTNTAVFRNNTSEDGCGCYVLVNDNGPGAGGAREARINVYATMSNISTGTNGTATTYIRKSNTADSTTRRWIVIADGRTAWVYLYLTGESNVWGNPHSLHGFGDIGSVLPVANTNRYFVLGRITENSSTGGQIRAFGGVAANYTSIQVADHTGVVAPLPCSLRADIGGYAWGSSYFGTDVSGNVVLEGGRPVFTSANTHAGHLRGLYLGASRLNNLTAGDLLTGSTNMVVMHGNTGAQQNETAFFGVAVDSVGPWS